jgi:tRNA/tmRNA/rRNA uracil-C5-methylase (TrmA/RlmC/RlmD family)
MTETLELEIERILPGGVGLGHADNKTFFVTLAAPGDRVRVRVDRSQGNISFASIVEVLSPSPQRVEPPCPYFGRCGGCDFQQLNYEAQLKAKSDIIRDCLHRITKLEYLPEIKVTASPQQWRYRGRATWQFDSEERSIGYYERGSRKVCDVADCAVLKPELQVVLEQVRAVDWSSVPAELKHLEVTATEESRSFSPEFESLRTETINLRVGDETYAYNAAAFFQANEFLLPALVQAALGDRTGKIAVDLYSGVGLFTIALARRFQKVIAVESSTKAIRFARTNLRDADLHNAKVVGTTATDWFRENSIKPGSVDFLLLDPPRVGAESVVIKGILALQPPRLCYVSCDPATLARDLKKLMAGGYELTSIEAFDMFPQTHHVETVVHLAHKDGE